MEFFCTSGSFEAKQRTRGSTPPCSNIAAFELNSVAMLDNARAANSWHTESSVNKTLNLARISKGHTKKIFCLVCPGGQVCSHKNQFQCQNYFFSSFLAN